MRGDHLLKRCRDVLDAKADDTWRVMMIKDILVTLPTGDAPSVALDYAVSVARSFDAHLTGITFVQDPASAGSLFDSARVMDGCRREVEDAAAAAKVRFEETWGSGHEPVSIA